MKRTLTAFDVAVCAAVVCLVAATLIPAIARVGRGDADARCQSNLQRWAEAMELYLADNYHRYPTNRPILSSGGLFIIFPYVNLSPDEIDPGTGKPMRFVYGITWVEALYPYIWNVAAKTDQNWKTFKCCPNARSTRWPDVPSMNTTVTYAFNRALAERPLVFVKDAKKLMAMREFGRLTISSLRPVNDATGMSAQPPISPFLCSSDSIVGDTSQECRLHGEGSYIVFADGHVRHFTMDFYPYLASWDPETAQWWNYAPSSGKGPPYLKSIAITP